MYQLFIQGPPASGKTKLIREFKREPLPPGVELWDEAHDHDTDLTFLSLVPTARVPCRSDFVDGGAGRVDPVRMQQMFYLTK